DGVSPGLPRGGRRDGQLAVDVALGVRALAVAHDVVVELLQRRVPVLAVGQALAVGRSCSTGHWLTGLLLGIRVLRAVQAATLLSILHARGVERAANDVVLDRG